MQKEILLYEIPIYSITEEKFNDKWNRRMKELKATFMKHGHTEESANQGIKNCCFPRYLWKYNQVVGYINISITNQDVIFGLFCTSDQNIRAISNTKHFIQKLDTGGMHFYMLHKENDYLKENMKCFLQGIKEMLPKKYYVDDTAFKNTIDNLNIRGVIDNIE